MNVSHMHIQVQDVRLSRQFYENHFGFREAFAHGDGHKVEVYWDRPKN